MVVISGKVFVFGQGGFIRAILSYSNTSGYIRERGLYSVRVGLFGQSG